MIQSTSPVLFFYMTPPFSAGLNWTCQPFSLLDAPALYAILRLRSEVFVVEQNCVYLDTDGKDELSWHCCGRINGQLAAYARLIPPGTSYETASIGRVVVAPAFRGQEMGRALMEEAIRKTFELYGGDSITIGAQTYLIRFYQSLGFSTVGEEYPEDGIPHITMILKK